MLEPNDIHYFQRIDKDTLNDLREIDISPIEPAFEKDCRIFILKYSLALIIDLFATYYLFLFNINLALHNHSIKGVITLFVLVMIPVICLFGIVSFSRAMKYKNLKGIKGTCDNIVKSWSKTGGRYYAYHCTTEIGQQGIAYTSTINPRATTGDSILYIRICNHDLIYKI